MASAIVCCDGACRCRDGPRLLAWWTAGQSHANLTSAYLAGANLETVVWSNTTCPDGSNSDTNGRNACP